MMKLVACVLTEVGSQAPTKGIREDTLLIEDLGLDSFSFVELTARLEEELQLDEFPMQEWVDACRDREQPLTVGALATAMSEAVAKQRDAG